MDGFFDEIDSILLLLLFLTTLNKEESELTEEGLEKEENDIAEEKLEEGLEVSIPEPIPEKEAFCYVHRSSNRKRLKPKAVYF